MGHGIGIRWTIGDVDPRGFAALRLSIWGAWRLFGPGAGYVVCVNGLPPDEARLRTGSVPDAVRWRTPGPLPDFIRPRLDGGMAEGVAWKLAPLRVFPERHELALDNDCILWTLPEGIVSWLRDPAADACLIAEDVEAALGAFADLCGPEPRNSGIRGLPPGFDLEGAMRRVLVLRPADLRSELDEQGLQVAAVSLHRPPHVVRTRDVTICSPFWPKTPALGRCGAHFVGLNARSLPWRWYDRPATDCVVENWESHLPELHRRVGLDWNGPIGAGLKPAWASRTA